MLLVTSRETRRWVIPKGNREAGLTPHAAAALEAEEEAGVRGAISPAAIGSYRYLKRKRSGVSVMLDVDVFPLAVAEELPVWKECSERERRWFTPGEAADAVDESDLAELIRGFDPARVETAGEMPSAEASLASRILARLRGLFRRVRANWGGS